MNKKEYVDNETVEFTNSSVIKEIDSKYIDSMEQLKDASLTGFLTANPYSDQFYENYGDSIKQSFFNKYLLFKSKKFDEEIKLLYQFILDRKLEESNIYKIIGYAHSGKTTFVRSFQRYVYNLSNVNEDVELTNFSESETDLFFIFDFSLAAYVGNDPTKSKSIKDVFLVEFANILRQLRKDKDKIFEIFEEIKTDYNKWYDLDDGTYSKMFFTKTDALLSYLNEDKFKFDSVREFEKNSDELSLPELIVLFILFVKYYSQHSTKEKKIIVVFESMDNLMTKDIIEFKDTLDHLSKDMGKLFGYLNAKTFLFRKNFSFLLVMRNVVDLLTSSRPKPESKDNEENQPIIFNINNRLTGSSKNTSDEIDMDIAPQSLIIEHRLDFILQNKSLFNAKLINYAEQFKSLLVNNIIFKHVEFYRMFDYDYVATVRMFEKLIAENWQDLALACKNLSLVNTDEKDFGKDLLNSLKFGLRQYVFRLMYNVFYNNKYFDEIGTKSDGSLARIILSYCINKTDCLNDSRKEQQPIDFIEICAAVLHLKPNGEKAVIDSCIQMFNLREEQRLWNHLICIENAGTNVGSEIETILLSNIEKKLNNVKIVLSSTGVMFVDKISVQFEYFACRYASESYPLFDVRNFEEKGENDFNIKKANNYKYIFECLIRFVYERAKICMKTCIDNDIVLAKKDSPYLIVWEKYKQKYCIKKNNNYLTHPERILHSHISYIDAYRLYAINYVIKEENNIEKVHDFNSRLLDLIQLYVNLGLELIKNNGDYFSEFTKKYLERVKANIDNQRNILKSIYYVNDITNVRKIFVKSISD
ncbi:MAG: hypothetical protein NC131_05865 [Roseburia sp.]|nr:hypothetical protein [Roseburia sp.]